MAATLALGIIVAPGRATAGSGPALAEPAPAPDSPPQEAEAEKNPPDQPALPHADDQKTWERAYAFIKMFDFETLWYLHFHYGNDGDVTYNEFSIGRGYLTMKVRPVEWFEPRITLDAHHDESGDMKVR
ncbi:MAG: hypothetical protein JRG91_07165, partial [Deltaproteobacteria bacterium]|nr:hypothetical protein [Deltaproteobacteria bacterium]